MSVITPVTALPANGVTAGALLSSTPNGRLYVATGAVGDVEVHLIYMLENGDWQKTGDAFHLDANDAKVLDFAIKDIGVYYHVLLDAPAPAGLVAYMKSMSSPTVVAGITSVAGGGTGLGTLTAHAVLVGEGTGNVVPVGPGVLGQILKSQGAADPIYENPLSVVADPGTGVAIPVTKDASVALVVGAGAETNTLAIPSYEGQLMVLACKSNGGGTRTVTAASAINVAGNTHMAFSAASQVLTLRGVQRGGALAWSVQGNDSVVLS